MNTLLAPVLLLAGLLAIFSFLIPGMRPHDQRFRAGRRPVRSWSDVPRMGSPDGSAHWVAPLVGLIAIASLVSIHGAAGASAGAVLGAVCGLLSTAGLAKVRDLGLSALGIVAALATAAALLAGNSCGGSLAVRLPVFVLTMVLFAGGLALSLLRGGVPAAVGLEAFALVEVVGFLSAPLGADLTPGPRWVSWIAAVVLGLLCGLAPRPMFGLVGAGVAVVTLWASTVTSNGCALDGGPGQVITVVAGAATFFLSSAVMRMLGR